MMIVPAQDDVLISLHCEQPDTDHSDNTTVRDGMKMTEEEPTYTSVDSFLPQFNKLVAVFLEESIYIKILIVIMCHSWIFDTFMPRHKDDRRRTNIYQ